LVPELTDFSILLSRLLVFFLRRIRLRGRDRFHWNYLNPCRDWFSVDGDYDTARLSRLLVFFLRRIRLRGRDRFLPVVLFPSLFQRPPKIPPQRVAIASSVQDLARLLHQVAKFLELCFINLRSCLLFFGGSFFGGSLSCANR
jgi:hypothetical protein